MLPLYHSNGKNATKWVALLLAIKKPVVRLVFFINASDYRRQSCAIFSAENFPLAISRSAVTVVFSWCFGVTMGACPL